MKRILQIFSFYLVASIALLAMSPPVMSFEEGFEEHDAASGKLTASVSFFDPSTGKAQSVFHPGDHVGYKVAIAIPASAEDHKATVSLDATLSIKGMELPFTLSSDMSGLVADPTGASLDLPFSRAWQGTFRIPGKTPPATLKVTAKVAIKGVGASTIKKELSVKR